MGSIKQNRQSKKLLIKMKFTTATLAAAVSATAADISGNLVAADTHFWTNPASITGNADSILKSWNGKYDKAMDDAFHMCTKGDFVTADDIWSAARRSPLLLSTRTHHST